MYARLICFVTVCCWLAVAGGRPSYPTFAPSSDRFNFFDAELLEVLGRERYGNVMISPIGVKMVLGMLMDGAVGASAEEIASALRLPKEGDVRGEFRQRLPSIQGSGSSSLKIANRVFVSDNYRIRPVYESKIWENYGGDIFHFRSGNSLQLTESVNFWVRNKTNGLIERLADYLPEDTRLMLANVMYFKGRWRTPFAEERTKNQCFKTDQTDCLLVPMMSEYGTYKYGYIGKIDAEALELPYEDGRFTMLLVLPRKRDGVRQLTRDMVHVTLEEVVSHLYEEQVSVQIPRFVAEFKSDLVPSLRYLQVSTVFGYGANLFGLSPDANNSLLVSNVLHSAKIVVDEEGSEAAAITGAILVPLMSGPNTVFVADHPFLFFVRDSSTGAILFAGRVERPEQAKAPANLQSSIRVTPVQAKAPANLQSSIRVTPVQAKAPANLQSSIGVTLQRREDMTFPTESFNRRPSWLQHEGWKQPRFKPAKNDRKNYYPDAINFFNYEPRVQTPSETDVKRWLEYQ